MTTDKIVPEQTLLDLILEHEFAHLTLKLPTYVSKLKGQISHFDEDVITLGRKQILRGNYFQSSKKTIEHNLNLGSTEKIIISVIKVGMLSRVLRLSQNAADVKP